jgi:hypothetical protein
VRHQRTVSIISICLLNAILGTSQARTTKEPPSPPLTTESSPADPEAGESRDRLAREMAKKANLERQAQLKSDTEKLLKLAEELKDYVDKSNENTLSLGVLKKAEEIEKLARSVKDKMRGPN